MQLWKRGLPSSRCSLHKSSREEGQDNSPQQDTCFSGSSFRFEEVSFLTLSLVPGETRASTFGGFPPQSLESNLADKITSRRCIFLSKHNYQTPSLENQGLSDKPQSSQLQNHVKHLKSVRSKYFLFPFEVLILKI